MNYNKYVKIWLCIGLFMLFVQIIVGGITRLTGSGLSITKWNIVTGTFPPTNQIAWDEAFDSYKETPQYEKINQGMTLSEFKFIFFWEYIHRLWARLMGFVFLFPCIFFLLKKWVDPPLLRRLGIVILLAVLAASFGWIMVASGLIERPWVNAYKLAIHLCIGIAVYAAMFWTCLYAFDFKKITISPSFKKFSSYLLILIIVQLFIGGVMSGMKAALFYPTWPDMNGDVFPHIIFNSSEWTVENFNNYEGSLLLPALIQVTHRFIAYILLFSGLCFFWNAIRMKYYSVVSKELILFISLLISQVILGIMILLSSIGSIPVLLGVLHQGIAILLLSSILFINYRLKD